MSLAAPSNLLTPRMFFPEKRAVKRDRCHRDREGRGGRETKQGKKHRNVGLTRVRCHTATKKTELEKFMDPGYAGAYALALKLPVVGSCTPA